MLRIIVKTTALAVLLGIVVGVATILARRAGIAVSDGFMIGVIVGAAGGVGSYFATSLKAMKAADRVKED